MFGLSNVRGSCWVNACLQSIFRIPAVQERYSKEIPFVNDFDKTLHRLWVSKGKDGLREFFAAVHTDLLPAGQDIGDSHELLIHLCDKLPWLDELFRFKVGYSLACKYCEYREIKDESTLEFTVHSEKEPLSISKCIVDATKLQVIDDWTCEKCKNKGCTKQMLMGSFPKTLLFHKISTEGSLTYASTLVINKRKYHLLSVICQNGFHWWTFARNWDEKTWYLLNDNQVKAHGQGEFPVSPSMRVLIYSCHEE